jgi:hypothetical protein
MQSARILLMPAIGENGWIIGRDKRIRGAVAYNPNFQVIYDVHRLSVMPHRGYDTGTDGLLERRLFNIRPPYIRYCKG